MFTRIAFIIVTVYEISSADAAYGKPRSDRIVFPGPTLETRYGDENAPVLVPDSCRNLTYCFEKPANYPQEKYDKMFEGKNLAPLPSIVESTIGNRLGTDDLEDDCDAVVRYDPLFTLRTSKGEWRNIIQAPTQNFQQKVRVEICTSRTTPCFKEYPQFGGITTFCRQKRAKYEFVVDDGKGATEKLEADLPACCVCHYTSPI